MLYRLREERDEVARAKVAAIDTLLLQMTMKIRQNNWNQAVEAVKI